jgi:hypothetical protein
MPDDSGSPKDKENKNDAQPETKKHKDGTPLNPIWILVLTVYLIVLSFVLFAGLMRFWPPSPGDGSWDVVIWGRTFRPSVEDRFFLTVIMSGALGAMVHTLRSFAWYAGNRDLKQSWAVRYLLVPFVGATLGLIFYLVIRGGFFSAQAQAGDTSPYGFAALAVLAGMFSEQAVLKLRQVAETVLTRAEQGKDHAKADSQPKQEAEAARAGATGDQPQAPSGKQEAGAQSQGAKKD